MKSRNLSIWAVLALLAGTGVNAAVSPEEAKKLGTTLTAVGADPSGSKDGVIPPYTGGLTTPPAGFKSGSGLRPDPFASDKPVLAITQKNMAEYADKLSEGAKGLLKKYPDYKIVVYPTHRSVAYPKWVLANTAKNAVHAKLVSNGNGIEGAFGGVPFPIPKNGNEVMWNHVTRYEGGSISTPSRAYLSNASGEVTMTTEFDWITEQEYYNPKLTSETFDGKLMQRTRTFTTGPARKAGEGLLSFDSLNPATTPRVAYVYLPGQRRVRLAPVVSFDTPNPIVGGAAVFDDVSMFNGSQERYDFKLVGKKEMYVPYNNYRMAYWSKPSELMQKGFLNPDIVRWELHRVWVVEATLKPGERHVYAKRVFYLDEDCWFVVATESYDARGQLYRTGFGYVVPSYDVPTPWTYMYGFYDLSTSNYFLSYLTSERGGVTYPTSFLSAKEWQPDALISNSIR